MTNRDGRLAKLALRLEHDDVITISVHNNDALWSKLLAMALQAGFIVLPGTFITSIVTHIPRRGLVTSHTAHLVRTPRAMPAPSARQETEPNPGFAAPGSDRTAPYGGVEFQ
jgi:hypothetical protein